LVVIESSNTHLSVWWNLKETARKAITNGSSLGKIKFFLL
jgi:hypothetical protein